MLLAMYSSVVQKNFPSHSSIFENHLLNDSALGELHILLNQDIFQSSSHLSDRSNPSYLSFSWWTKPRHSEAVSREINERTLGILRTGLSSPPTLPNRRYEHQKEDERKSQWCRVTEVLSGENLHCRMQCDVEIPKVAWNKSAQALKIICLWQEEAQRGLIHCAAKHGSRTDNLEESTSRDFAYTFTAK